MDEHKKTNQPKKKKGRSPSYPGIDIQTALKRAQELYAKEKRYKVNVKTAAAHWDYKFGSGISNITLAALKKYDFLIEEGRGDTRTIQLTDLAHRIIIDEREESEDRERLIIKAALNPKIHKELYEKYNEEGLPSEKSLKFELCTDREFTESGAEEFIAQFKRTLSYINNLKSDIILPDNGDKGREGKETKPPFVPPPKGGFKPPTPPKGENMKNVEIPIATHPWPVLTVRFPMPKAMWDQMMVMLKAMESAIVESEEAKENLSTGEENPE